MAKRLSSGGRVLATGLLAVWGCLVAGQASTFARQADADRSGAVREQLRQMVAEARKFEEAGYTADTWNPMWLAAYDARRLTEKRDATPAELEAAIASLSGRVSALQKRPALVEPRLPAGLAASLFATDPAGPVNNVALQWASAKPCDKYEILRSTGESGPWVTIYEGTGRSYRDYDLAGGTYLYRLIGHRGDTRISAGPTKITTTPPATGVKAFSNQTTNAVGLRGKPIKVRGTYYDFRMVRDGKGVKVVQRTSPDGSTWTDGPVVMDASDHPDLADCKLEAITCFYDARNDQIVWWCHWEISGPTYGHGRALVATGKPGQRWKVHHNYTPLGVQVRDMSVFVDDDGKGYLAAASNLPGQGANATLYIFELNRTLDDVVRIVSKVAENGYREAPHIVRKGEFYYLFYSQAAGWFPSRGGYASARSLEGPWSELRTIGNPSTFAAQSGGIAEFGTEEAHVPLMMANRWIRGEGTSPNSVLPIQMAEGFAFFDYAPTLLHDAARGLVVPVDAGRLLSQGRPAESSIAGKPGQGPDKAFDGDYDTAFQSDDRKWPFTLTTDLGTPARVKNVQISWYLHKGSEAFYTYQIETSPDGQTWTVVADRSDAKSPVISRTYGFTSDLITEAAPARFVRVKVLRAHLHNNPNNWYPPTIYEIKVFGDKAE